MSVLEEVINYLRGASAAEKASFMSQLSKERGLWDELKALGFTPPVSESDQTGRNIIAQIDTVVNQTQFEEMTWLQWILDGNYSESWSDPLRTGESFFRKSLYHGRLGAYFANEVGLGYTDWTIPLITEKGENAFEEEPWTRALRVRNENPSKIGERTALYCGLPKAHFDVVFCFWANLSDGSDNRATGGAGVSEHYIGFEVPAGGSFSIIQCLAAYNGGWHLRAANYSALHVQDVTINNPNVYARYCLVKDQTNKQLRLWQAPAGVPDGFPLVKTNTLSVAASTNEEDIIGKTIPFFANEDKIGISEFRLSRYWIYERD